MRDTKRLLWNTFRDWWYMPVNLLLTFFIGGFFGWIVVKITTPRHLSGLVIENCVAGNIGNLLLIIILAICEQKASPFEDVGVCMDYGMAYASFYMEIKAIYIWSIVYNIVRSSLYQRDKETQIEARIEEKIPRKDSSNTGLQSSLLEGVHTWIYLQCLVDP
jgi:predicted permease